MRKTTLLSAALLLFMLDSSAQENFQPGTQMSGAIPIEKVNETLNMASKTSPTGLASRPSTGMPTGSSSEVGVTQGQLEVSLSGGANYNIPVDIPPGINKVAPAVSLSYNSQGGNGLAGYGWNVSGISTITRIPRTKFHDNSVGRVGHNVDDRFALDGQRLIIKSATAGNYGINGTVYETESFSNIRITSYGTHPDGVLYGPAYFIVEYPDGSVAHYGNSLTSRSINEWSITYWQNAQGLRINYEYNKAFNDLSIFRISYGARLAENSPNKIEFSYKQRIFRENTYTDGLAMTKQNMLDEIKVYGNSSAFRSYKLSHTTTGLGYERLSSIKETSGDGRSLNPTVFTYGEESDGAQYQSLETTLSMQNVNMNNTASISGDFNGDGKTDFILYPTNGTVAKTKYWVFNNLDAESNNVGFEVNNIGIFQDIFPVSWLGGSASFGYKLMQSQGWAILKNGTSTLDITTYSLGTAAPYYYQYARNIPYTGIGGTGTRYNYSGDFDGDGLTDIVTIRGLKPYFINLDPRIISNFVNDAGSLTSSISAEDKVFVADFDGDGKSDLYHFKAGRIRIYRLTDQNQFELIANYADATLGTGMNILMGDYNGDGMADFLIPDSYNSSSYSLHYSTGKGFSKSTASFPFNYLQSNRSGDCIRYYHLIPSDFNGDGKTDLLWVSNYCNNATQSSIDVHYYANTSSGFKLKASAPSQARTTIGQDRQPVLPVALGFNIVNGESEINFLSGKYIHRFKSVKSHQKAVQLNEITLGNGLKQAITYAPLISDSENSYLDTYVPSDYKENYPFYDIRVAPEFKVVRMLEEISNTDYKKQTYSYFGGVASVDGLGFLGFKATKKSNWHNVDHSVIASITKYDVSKRGMPNETFSVLGDYHASSLLPSNYISRTTFENGFELLGNKVYKAKVLSSVNHNRLQGITTEFSAVYDNYLNPEVTTEIVKRGSLVDQTKSTIIGYQNTEDTTPYIIGRLLSKDVTVSHDGDVSSSGEIYTFNSAQLLEQSKIKGHNTSYITEDNIYDVFGNLKQKTVSVQGEIPRAAKFEYDISGRFLKKSTDIQGLESLFDYNPNNGTLQSETDPYGRVTQYAYDSWFRRIRAVDYLGKGTLWTYSKPDQKSSQILLAGDDGSSSMTKYDDLGRAVISGIKNVTGTWSYVIKSYDIYGRLFSIGEPVSQVSASPSQVSTTNFDEYGRPVKINSFTGQITEISYEGLVVTSDDETKVVIATKDGIGNTLSITENANSTINYKYFANGNLKKTIFEGTETVIEQDGWGRKTKLIDNSAGTYIYEYNGYSDITKEITPKGTTQYEFDDYGKLIEKRIVGALTDSKTTFAYDAQTKLLTSSRFDDFIEGDYAIYDYVYDSYKRLSLTGESRFLAYYQRAWQYDDFGRPSRELYTAILTANGQRSDKWISNQYKNGYLWQLRDGDSNKVLWQINAVNDRGQMTNATFGGLLETKVVNSYDTFGLPSQINYSRTGYQPRDQPYVPAIEFMTLNYAFDPITKNLSSRTNSSFDWNEAFTYDNFNRLKTFTNSKGANEEQAYDSKGRIESNGIGDYSYHPQNTYQNTTIEMNEEAKSYYTNREGVFNDGMEEQKGWTTYWNPATVSYDNAASHSGNYSMKIVNPTSSEIMAISETRIPVNNTVDTEYTYSAWVVGTGQAEMFLYMGTQNTLGSYDTVDNIIYDTTGEWVKIEKTIIVPASVKFLSLRLDNNGGGTMWFDDARIRKTGNGTTSLRELNISYNAFKAPVQIEETGVEKISYTYNSANQRSSMFYGGLQEDKMQRTNRKHYSIEGSMEIKHNVVSGATEFLTYIGGNAYTAPLVLKSDGTSQEYLKLFRDYQGTILGIANSSDVLLEKRLFDAWGNILSVMDGQGNKLAGLTVVDRGYTGHEHLQSVGLIHMNARLYDSKLHRFLQPDNNVQNISDSQNYNRYSYVLNNPLKYVDPSGETSQDCVECGSGQNLGTGAQVGIGGIISSLALNWDEMGIKDWSKQNWESFRKDWKSGTNFMSDNLKSFNNDIDKLFRSIEKAWNKLWGNSKAETIKISTPQFSNFQISSGWQNVGFQSGTLGVQATNELQGLNIGYKKLNFDNLKAGVKVGINLSKSLEFIQAMDKVSGGNNKFLGKFGKFGGPLTSGLEIVYNGVELYQGDISGYRFSYRTGGVVASFVVGAEIGATFGGPWGFAAGAVVGGGATLTESAFDIWLEQFTHSMNHFYNNVNYGISLYH